MQKETGPLAMREKTGRHTEEQNLVTRKLRRVLGPTSTQSFEGGSAEGGDLDHLEEIAFENCYIPIVQHYTVYVSNSHMNALTAGIVD